MLWESWGGGEVGTLVRRLEFVDDDVPAGGIWQKASDPAK
jgi:hypothetical protein